MAGGGDHPGANKRNREAAGMPKRAKRKKPYEDPAVCGGSGAKGKPQPVTAKDNRVAAKEMLESRKPDYDLEKVRRHIIRILKKQIMKLAVSDYGCLVVLEELTEELKELIFDKVKGIPSL